MDELHDGRVMQVEAKDLIESLSFQREKMADDAATWRAKAVAMEREADTMRKRIQELEAEIALIKKGEANKLARRK